MTVRLKGFDGIDRALKRLERSARADALIGALEESAQPFEDRYRAGAPPVIRPGTRTRTVEKRADKANVAVGSRHPLAHIFEFGTKRRRTKGRGPVQFTPARRGKIIPIGFGRRAFDATVNGWFGSVGKLIWRRIARVGR